MSARAAVRTPAQVEKAQINKKLTSRDLFSLKLIEDPQISPDGKNSLFTLKTFEPKTNEYQTSIQHISLDKAQASPRPFTRGPRDYSPRFSPDGEKIAFLSTIDKVSHVKMMPIDGGESQTIFKTKEEVSGLTWSPDGKRLAFSALVTEKGLLSGDEKPEEDDCKKFNADVKIIKRLWHKLDGQGFVHDRRRQIFVLDVETGKTSQITIGDFDASGPAFSPDGEWIAFTSNRDPGSDGEPIAHIYKIRAEGGTPQNLTPGKYAFMDPAFSPDGKRIAFEGYENPYNWYDTPRLWTVDVNGKNLECLTRELDRPMGNHALDDLRGMAHIEKPAWSGDSRTLYASVSADGSNRFVGVDIQTKTVGYLSPEGQTAYAWAVAGKADAAVIGSSNPLIPNDLWKIDLASGKTTKITEINASFTEKFPLSSPENFSAKSKDGTVVEGWILKPPYFETGKKYPAVLEIHGGPMCMYAWSFFFEFQLLAHAGYVVVYSNPRGGMGNGQAFCEAIKGDWGNLDFQDLTAVADHAVKLEYVDEKRFGVAGGSYGGFMTNWVIGHTDRFKAAITMRSVTNELSYYGTADYGFQGEQNLGCLPWEKPETYLKMSPITYVKNIKTPLLIIHSEEDYRCPMEQAEQLYAALKKLKREAVFVRFPGESHDLSRTGKPWHRVYRLDLILDWFNAHL